LVHFSRKKGKDCGEKMNRRSLEKKKELSFKGGSGERKGKGNSKKRTKVPSKRERGGTSKKEGSPKGPKGQVVLGVGCCETRGSQNVLMLSESINKKKKRGKS